MLVVAAGIPDDATQVVGHVGTVRHFAGIARLVHGNPIEARPTGRVLDAGVPLRRAQFRIIVFKIVLLCFVCPRKSTAGDFRWWGWTETGLVVYWLM